MQKRIFCRIYMALTICCTACGHSDLGKSQAEVAAKEFAEAYFNYDFGKAAQYATDNSRKWIEFKASNIGEDDIAILREQENGATVEITDADQYNENNATVSLRISNFLETDTLGGKGHVVDEASINLHLQLTTEGKWKVRMEGPLRSGK